MVFQDGSLYQGSVQDGVPHGSGTWSSIEGEVYEGEWKWGKRHGKGKCTWVDGEVSNRNGIVWVCGCGRV